MQIISQERMAESTSAECSNRTCQYVEVLHPAVAPVRHAHRPDPVMPDGDQPGQQEPTPATPPLPPDPTHPPSPAIDEPPDTQQPQRLAIQFR